MRFGVSTPVVIQIPGATSEWGRDAGIEDLARVAAAADELGFDYLTCPEHVVVPEHVAAQRGTTNWDPLATLAFAALTGGSAGHHDPRRSQIHRIEQKCCRVELPAEFNVI